MTTALVCLACFSVGVVIGVAICLLIGTGATNGTK